ncbi:MAG: sulfatase [Halioglobus sp.]
MTPARLLLFALLLVFSLSLTAADRPPNIVMLIADDQAWADHGFIGHPHIRTPNLDQLAEQGLLFTRGYVPTALCRPSLASLMTGLYPHQHRITGNRVGQPVSKARQPAAEAELAASFSSLPRLAALLDNAGYRSFQTGKWWEGDYSRGGFSAGMSSEESLDIGRKTMQPLFDFIDEHAEQPFFLWYAPYLPHFPHNPPQRLISRYLKEQIHPEMAKYYAMIEWNDETIGQLVEYLRQSGHADNTVFVYLADNGWIQPTAQVEGHPWYYGAPRGKGSPYENGIRTPIILSWPGHISAGSTDTPVSSIDLAPTLLRLAGQPVPSTMMGLDLLDEKARIARPAVYGASFKHSINPGVATAAAVRNRWLVNGDWKLIHHRGQQGAAASVELFDLGKDPEEKNNLAGQEATVDRLLALLDAWWAP